MSALRSPLCPTRRSRPPIQPLRLVAVLPVVAALLSLGVGCAKKQPPAPAADPSPALPPAPASPLLVEGEAGEAADPAASTPGFVRVPDGEFVMGSPAAELDRSADETPHRVTIQRSFEMQATEVTQEQYELLIGRNPANNTACGGRCPVEQVSWFEAVHYCNELSRRRKLPLCYVEAGLAITLKSVHCGGYRLPTEAEWEYAARGGAAGARHGGVGAVAWYDLNAKMHSHPVATKKSNGYGLYDMLGNVFEWVWDWKGPYDAATGVDPRGPATGDNRVFRGGAYRWGADEARSAFRNAYGPKNKVEWIGFRCVRSLR